MDPETDLLLDGEGAFERMFSPEEAAPDGAAMVRGEHEPSALAEPPVPAEPKPDVRQIVDDRVALAQEKARADALAKQIAEAGRQNTERDQEPDFFADPVKFQQRQAALIRQQIMQEVRQTQLPIAQMLAEQIHTPQVVEEAAKAFGEAAAHATIPRQEWERIRNSANPFHEAVLWHKRQTVQKEVGDDPEAFFERRLADKMKDPAFQARVIAASRGQSLAAVPTPAAAAPAAPARRPLPSLSNVGNAATANATVRDMDEDEAMSLVPGR